MTLEKGTHGHGAFEALFCQRADGSVASWTRVRGPGLLGVLWGLAKIYLGPLQTEPQNPGSAC